MVTNNFSHMGDESTGPMLTILGTLGVLNYLINYANFGVDRFKGFYSVSG
jgi:hypothetical protein